MKQFLYLDTDIVNSIIAQSDKGIILSLSSEQEASHSDQTSVSKSTDGSTSVGGSIFKLFKAETNLSGRFEKVDGNAFATASKEIIVKTLHDASFDIAYETIKPSKINLDNQQKHEIGSYVEVKRVFDFIDLEYLEGFFAEDGIVDFIKKTSAEKIENDVEKVKQGYNREQLRKINASFKSEVKRLITLNNKQYNDAASIIKAVSSIIPYSRLLISSDGYLIPLVDKYFRVELADIGFKYGGEITCVGLITNIIQNNNDKADEKNLFAALQHSSNQVLISLLPVKDKKLFVIHPIAIYYGE